MNNVDVKAESQALKDAAVKIQGFSENFEEIYKSLIEQVRGMKDVYLGPDSDAFIAKMEELVPKFRAMADSISNASKTLDTQAKNYDELQQRSSNRINKLS